MHNQQIEKSGADNHCMAFSRIPGKRNIKSR